MENATKAILIAGSMLLTILALSLFSYIFKNLSESSGRIYEEMNESQINEFNQNFTKYEGRNEALTMQEVISIVNLAKNNNISKVRPVTVIVNLKGASGVNDTDDLTSFNESKLMEILKNNYEKKFSKCECEFSNTKLVNKVKIE